ncbi:SpvB/TcaC N-terminal domain-containing protein [Cohnella suwonensis]|uniref:SpvB/TcaC N-terminal domain-containing protein n=1 Tax=Cohnella suwonensis TaxID=696072 RepID=A0ABW0M231_9BACL
MKQSDTGKSAYPTGHSDKGHSPLPGITLPKGGGAVRGIGEQFSVRSLTGTASAAVPLSLTPGRSGFSPELSLTYDSGAGNGPFGLGWNLTASSVTRKTDKGLPRYRDAEESDAFLLSGMEELVPFAGQELRIEGHYEVRRYRPRVEASPSRIERWEHRETGESYWRVVSGSNVTSLYGLSANGRISDPSHPERVYQWLLEETSDDKGNVIRYGYKPENGQGIDRGSPSERNRIGYANRYLKTIRYGNRNPHEREGWLFTVVLDYGEHDPVRPTEEEIRLWPCRHDPFSTNRAGFEIRTYRLCRRILMFHHFEELGETPCLVRSDEFSYEEGKALSFLKSVTRSGYIRQADGSYVKKSMPPVQYEYSRSSLDFSVQTLDEASMANMPEGLRGRGSHWTDLYGEGLSGILTEHHDAWYYKRNLGGGRFSPMDQVAVKPSAVALNENGWRLTDLDGDGGRYAVQYSGPSAGYHEHDSETKAGWGRFTSFAALPNIDWNDPNLRYIDVTGDGKPDLLVTEQNAFSVYESLGREGFDAGDRVPVWDDEEKGPALVFSDETQSIFLADMSGDGLTDIVRIRNGEVCYWPNLGYGTFGAKMTMNDSPAFDFPDGFDRQRIRLYDLDGSGPADLLYLGGNDIRFWLNLAGNGWSETQLISSLSYNSPNTSIDVVDLLGNGTGCLVWSSSLPSDEGRPIQYIDLTGGTKPHLMTAVINNMGAETHIRYAPSTRFFLQDRLEGLDWVTQLPFPVHVVSQVETIDRIGGNRVVTRYAYRHGYYDRKEREFHGFGRVDQWDTEAFGLASDTAAVPRLPPVRTITWHHTGAYFERDTVSRKYAAEYFRESGLPEAATNRLLLPDTPLPSGLTVEEEREVCRALRGSMLRQEVYAEDGTERSGLPYTIAERSYQAELLQPQGVYRNAVIRVQGWESMDYHLERNPADPRISHQLTLETDSYGNVVRSAAIGYGRRIADPALSPEDQAKQAAMHIVLTENRHTNGIDQDGTFRLPVVYETRSYELTGLPAAGVRLPWVEVLIAADAATEIAHEEKPDGTLQKRLLAGTRTRFRRNDLSGGLPAGMLESLALPYASYQMAFTPGMLAECYPDIEAVGLLLDEGGYVRFDGDPHWWIPSGTATYSEGAENRFFLPDGFIDIAGNASSVNYDRYGLLAVRSVDPLGNTVNCENDYRVLQPCRMTDLNGNRSGVCFDVLGMVTGTAVSGKDGESAGDTLDGFLADLDDATILHLMEHPLEEPHQWLARASSRTVYDMERYLRTSGNEHPQPNVACTFTRETHDADLPLGGTTRTCVRFLYSDGFGRTVQSKNQAEPGEVDGKSSAERWIGTGWTVYNNKGKAYKSYEPFFSKNHGYEVKQQGVSTTVLYDPVGRAVVTIHPDHSYEKVVFDPWRQISWDANDTIHPSFRYDPRGGHQHELPDPAFHPADDPDVGGYFRSLPDGEYLPTWYAARMVPELAQAKWPDFDPVTGKPIPGQVTVRAEEYMAAVRAARHAATPTVAYADNLGQTFLAVADNGKDASGTDRFLDTRTYPDVLGRSEKTEDALGRTVTEMRYDMTGRTLHESGMDAGFRLAFMHADGQALYSWNSRGFHYRYTYDALRRPLAVYVQQDNGTEFLIARTVYGEAHPDSRLNEAGVPVSGKLNLRGKVWMVLDGAGALVNVGTNPQTGEEMAYEFKGNLLSSSRRLAKDYKGQTDWSSAESILLEMKMTGADLREKLQDALNLRLENESFHSHNRYDALNRPILTTAPDGSVLRPVYNGAGLLEQVHVRIRGQENPETVFVERLDYDEKGQRQRIVYGNGATTTYQYNPETYRTSRIVTKRAADTVQDLRYTYDPVGNIHLVHDAARQDIFYNNQVVSAGNHYYYDALYRLTEAKGREHIGLAERPHADYDDGPRTNLPHPSDGSAMRLYHEFYLYDDAGNLTHLIHQTGSGSWQRIFRYEERSLLESSRFNNRLSGSNAGSVMETYGYDEHGNMTSLPHLGEMSWDHADKLRKVNLGGGGTAYYVYDSSGQRVRKVIERLNGTRQKERLYLGGFEVYREYGGDGEQVALERETLHVMDDERRIALVETRSQGTDNSPEQLVRYQMSARLESCSLELDEEARIISYEEYYPYGGTSCQAVWTDIEVPRKRYRYTGKERDEETGFYDHGARYYAPWLCRWTAADPIGTGDGLNVYAYVSGNPIGLSDPTGTSGADDEPIIRAYDIPQVSGPDYSLYAEPGMVYTSYNQAWDGVVNPNNSPWERGAFGVLAVASLPLAFAEESGRMIVNIPHVLLNGGKSLGEHSARGYLLAKAGEPGDAFVEGLYAVQDTSIAFLETTVAIAPGTGPVKTAAALETEAAIAAMRTESKMAASAVAESGAAMAQSTGKSAGKTATSTFKGKARPPRIPIVNPRIVPEGALGEGIVGKAYPARTRQLYPRTGLLGKLGVKQPRYFRPSIDIVDSLKGSEFRKTLKHERMHVRDFLTRPELMYHGLGARSTLRSWIIPGRGFAQYWLEARAYSRELGWSGVLPDSVLGSMWDWRPMWNLIYDSLWTGGLSYGLYQTYAAE